MYFVLDCASGTFKESYGPLRMEHPAGRLFHLLPAAGRAHDAEFWFVHTDWPLSVRGGQASLLRERLLLAAGEGGARFHLPRKANPCIVVPTDFGDLEVRPHYDPDMPWPVGVRPGRPMPSLPVYSCGAPPCRPVPLPDKFSEGIVDGVFIEQRLNKEYGDCGGQISVFFGRRAVGPAQHPIPGNYYWVAFDSNLAPEEAAAAAVRAAPPPPPAIGDLTGGTWGSSWIRRSGDLAEAAMLLMRSCAGADELHFMASDHAGAAGVNNYMTCGVGRHAPGGELTGLFSAATDRGGDVVARLTATLLRCIDARLCEVVPTPVQRGFQLRAPRDPETYSRLRAAVPPSSFVAAVAAATPNTFHADLDHDLPARAIATCLQAFLNEYLAEPHPAAAQHALSLLANSQARLCRRQAEHWTQCLAFAAEGGAPDALLALSQAPHRPREFRFNSGWIRPDQCWELTPGQHGHVALPIRAVPARIMRLFTPGQPLQARFQVRLGPLPVRVAPPGNVMACLDWLKLLAGLGVTPDLCTRSGATLAAATGAAAPTTG